MRATQHRQHAGIIAACGGPAYACRLPIHDFCMPVSESCYYIFWIWSWVRRVCGICCTSNRSVGYCYCKVKGKVCANRQNSWRLIFSPWSVEYFKLNKHCELLPKGSQPQVIASLMENGIMEKKMQIEIRRLDMNRWMLLFVFVFFSFFVGASPDWARDWMANTGCFTWNDC